MLDIFHLFVGKRSAFLSGNNQLTFISSTKNYKEIYASNLRKSIYVCYLQRDVCLQLRTGTVFCQQTVENKMTSELRAFRVGVADQCGINDALFPGDDLTSWRSHWKLPFVTIRQFFP